MPWPWTRKLTGSDAEVAVRVIRHLQTQAALQQLAMETYNDAMGVAGERMHKGDELFLRGMAAVDSPELAAQYVLPAAEKKVAIAESMVAEHQAFDISDAPKDAIAAYYKQTEFLTVLLARARLQRTCWRDWVDNPSLGLSERMNSLDQAENESMLAAINELNGLIKRAGVSGEPWLSINCAAFNDVRGRIGLPPLTETDFRARFLQGVSGGRARFFE